MFSHIKPTKSEATKDRYLARYESLKRQLCRQEGSHDESPEEVTKYLINRRSSFSMSTWRQYKAATLYYLQHFTTCHSAIEELEDQSSKGLAVRSKNTSGRKLKKVPDKLWTLLSNVLHVRARLGLKYAGGLHDMLAATLLCGLRPSEWSHSEIAAHAASGRKILRVRNSKRTNGRANGEFREIFIHDLDAQEISLIEYAVSFCHRKTDKEAELLRLALRDEMKAAKRQLMQSGQRLSKDQLEAISAYSFRHQFVANAKRTFTEPEVISALVGHNSTQTAFKHYGKRRNGIEHSVKVFPTPETIAAVHRVRLEMYKHLVTQRASTSPAPDQPRPSDFEFEP